MTEWYFTDQIRLQNFQTENNIIDSQINILMFLRISPPISVRFYLGKKHFADQKSEITKVDGGEGKKMIMCSVDSFRIEKIRFIL